LLHYSAVVHITPLFCSCSGLVHVCMRYQREGLCRSSGDGYTLHFAGMGCEAPSVTMCCFVDPPPPPPLPRPPPSCCWPGTPFSPSLRRPPAHEQKIRLALRRGANVRDRAFFLLTRDSIRFVPSESVWGGGSCGAKLLFFSVPRDC